MERLLDRVMLRPGSAGASTREIAGYDGLCAVLEGDGAQGAAPSVRSTVRAGRSICLAGQRPEGPILLREGWAVRYAQLSDGRRQILSVLLPGDVLALGALARAPLDFSIQALTDVSLSHVDSESLRQRVMQEPGLFEIVARLFDAERARADISLTDVGQRPAEERIASFILQIRERLTQRGLMDGTSFACPLRQRHIADAMGLTPVHVNRVFRQLRATGVLDFQRDVITVLDPDALRSIANIRPSLTRI